MTLRSDNLVLYLIETGGSIVSHGSKRQECPGNGRPTGCPVCLVLKQGAINQLFLEVFLMFLACLDHKWWAEFHLGILGPQE